MGIDNNSNFGNTEFDMPIDYLIEIGSLVLERRRGVWPYSLTNYLINIFNVSYTVTDTKPTYVI